MWIPPSNILCKVSEPIEIGKSKRMFQLDKAQLKLDLTKEYGRVKNSYTQFLPSVFAEVLNFVYTQNTLYQI